MDRKILPWTTRFALLIILILSGCGSPTANPTLEPIYPTTTATSTEQPTPSISAPVPLVYDDDGSRDGTVALLYLLLIPDFSVKSVTISFGEAHPATYIQFIGRMLDQLGYATIPLGEGQDAPITPLGVPFPDWLRSLSDVFWHYPLENSSKVYPVQPAPALMVSAIEQSDQPVIIFQSGTFTTLAQALRLNPSIKEKIKAVYFMGGAINVPGNITNLIPDSTNHVAEWNLLADPQAAAEVFQSGLTLYMVPLDTTNKVKSTQAELLPWKQGGPVAAMASNLYDIMYNEYGFSEAEIFDLAAAVLTARPDLCDFQPLHLEVVTTQGDTLGQTAVVSGGDPNVYACLDPQVEQIKQELDRVFSGE
jgi:pyrimidine-specific ribonucleoside hydrolase